MSEQIPKPQFVCKNCNRIVFNRRLSKCEFCGTELPDSVVLSTAQIEAIDKEKKKLQDDRRRDKERRREIIDSQFGGTKRNPT